jgi:transposase
MKVIRHLQPRYACLACEAVLQAPVHDLPVEKGRPGPGLHFFCADLTASQATELGNLDRKTTMRLFTLFRARMAEIATRDCPRRRGGSR